MTYKNTLGLTLLAAATALTACGDSGENPENGDFVSDNPGSGGGYGGDDAGQGETGGGTDGGDDGGNGDGGDDGQRAIAEADIIQLDGDRLYALSAYGGLTVIDVSTPDVFPVLGRYRANARPFEMYIDNGQVFVMYTDYGSYEFDVDLQAYTWHSASRLMALDASNPANIQVRGEFDMPGWIQDSRRVGDVLYLVTYEDGWCWSCDETPNTTITSLDVSDEANVELVDQLTFADEESAGWGWGARSVSATDERLYVAGMDWSNNGEGSSTIDVIDISDPGGSMFLGAKVPVAGSIESRWQMDEHDGVLRVISQPGWWGSDQPPTIETFSVGSSNDITALGSTQMVLPRPESLRSVRFDGERGYAITFERTDPLFTIDLSDPADPRQMGELEIPGWVYHMEPRGDRILGLGFDDGNAQGSLNLSLFDVSDFDNPTMLSRVHFGGDWGSFAEDQNRIHKAFSILDELGLLLVPFSGYDYDGDDFEGCGSYRSGIQLVDWANDDLALRGIAGSHGQARRALVHGGRLLSVSDMAVESFDFTNRDAPAKTGELALASNVSGISTEGDAVARLSIDWWTNSVVLETTTMDRAAEPEPMGRLDLSTLVEQHPYECGYFGLYNAQVISHDGFAYLVRGDYDYDEWGTGSTIIDVIDARNPSNPTFVRSVELPFLWDPYGGYYGYGDWYGYGFGYGYGEGGSVVLAGDALIMQTTENRYSDNGEEWLGSSAQVHVVDLSIPGDPQMGATLSRPDGMSHGALTMVDDQTLVSWHMRRANDDGSKVRFYLDRFDVSGGSASADTPVNVPGAVVGYDRDSRRAITVDFKLQRIDMTEDECWQHPQTHGFDYDASTCELAHRDLAIVQVAGDGAYILDQASVENGQGSLRNIAADSGRLYAHVGNPNYWWGVVPGGEVDVGPHVRQDQLIVFEDWESGEFRERARVYTGATGGWLGQLRPVGDKLLFNADNGLGELDTTNASAPQLKVHDLYGYGCWNLTTTDTQAMCAMGEFGLQIIDL